MEKRFPKKLENAAFFGAEAMAGTDAMMRHFGIATGPFVCWRNRENIGGPTLMIRIEEVDDMLSR